MRASLGKQHKALVKVLGVSMLERNILTLLSHDVREIFLAVGASERSVLAYARGRGQRVARAGGAELKLYIEKHPRGSIGAARAIRTAFDDLLVVNVDNLTSLDLTALVEHHRATKAVLTIATHIEPFQVPFGQVSIKDGEIVDYWEKPVLPVPLCSGTYVLGKIARLNIPLNRPSGAPELVHILLRAKQMCIRDSYNTKLDSIQAKVLSWKLPSLDQWNEQRRTIARQYRERLTDLPLKFQSWAEGEEHVFHLFAIRTEKRDELLNHLQSRGVDAVIRYPVPIHLQPAFSQYGWRRGQFPVAEALARELLCLPIRPNLTTAEVEYVADCVRSFFKGGARINS